jgi:hypothetical protein
VVGDIVLIAKKLLAITEDIAIEDGTPNKTEINKLSMQELTQRMSEF